MSSPRLWPRALMSEADCPTRLFIQSSHRSSGIGEKLHARFQFACSVEPIVIGASEKLITPESSAVSGMGRDCGLIPVRGPHEICKFCTACAKQPLAVNVPLMSPPAPKLYVLELMPRLS